MSSCPQSSHELPGAFFYTFEILGWYQYWPMRTSEIVLVADKIKFSQCSFAVLRIDDVRIVEMIPGCYLRVHVL